MKKLLIAAAIAATTCGAFVGQGQAAPAQDPMCKMGGQTTNQNWMDHYGCWKGQMAKPVAAKPSKKDPMCGMGVQGTNQGWMDHYGCWGAVKRW
jgi:YHS domain-containing protein